MESPSNISSLLLISNGFGSSDNRALINLALFLNITSIENINIK
jgi:hypothetical protein